MNNEQQSTIHLRGKWYLIQRATEYTGDRKAEKTGVNRILDLDYMGSAEFEFGAVGTSLRKYREAGVAGNLKIFKTGIKLRNGGYIWALCHRRYDEVAVENEIVKATTSDNYQVKEVPRMAPFLEGYVPGSFDYTPDISVWLNIHGDRDFDLVIWALKKNVLTELFEELGKETPTARGTPDEVPKDPMQVVDGTELSLFDTVEVIARHYHGLAQVVSIYDKTCDIKTSDGRRLKGIPWSEIRRSIVSNAIR